MGETKVGIAAKVPAELAAAIERIANQYPLLIEGRSSMVRILLELAVAGIASGRIPSTPQGWQEYLCELRKPELVKKVTR